MAIPLPLTSEKFAEYRQTIKAFYESDEEFRALCDDYSTSKMNSQRIKKENLKNKKIEVEYKLLSSELEDEIMNYVTKRIK